MTRHRDKAELFVARNTARDVNQLARQMARTDERRAASQFYHRQEIGPVRPLTPDEILARFADQGFGRAQRGQEQEHGRADLSGVASAKPDHARHYNPAPKPPWPSAREQRRPYQQDNNRPAAGLGLDELAERVQRIIDDPTREADEHDGRVLQAVQERRELDPGKLAERVQRIIDDPTREADEHDDRVLQALQARREQGQTAQTATPADEAQRSSSSEEPAAESSAEKDAKAVDAAVGDKEMTEDRQAQYSRFTGEKLGPRASFGQEEGRSQGGGGRTRTR